MWVQECYEYVYELQDFGATIDLLCRVCACGSYGGGDIHEGGGGRMTQELSPISHQQNEVLEGRTQGILAVTTCLLFTNRLAPQVFATSSVCPLCNNEREDY